MNVDEAFELLDLDNTDQPSKIKERWKRLRTQAHPDHGGDADKFHLLLQAYKVALGYAEEPKMCDDCQGKGRVSVTTGFHTTKIRCNQCGGSGVLGD